MMKMMGDSRRGRLERGEGVLVRDWLGGTRWSEAGWMDGWGFVDPDR